MRIYDLPVKEASDLEKVFDSLINMDERFTGIDEDISIAKKMGEWTIGWINGFFSAVHYFLRGYEEFLIDLALNPQMAQEMIRKTGEFNLKAAEKFCKAGVDCIGFCDDLGSGQSLLISPAMYRDFIWPWHKKLCDLAHDYGVYVHMHSHGAIGPILKDIKEAGVDILNPVDPDDKMDMNLTREILGKKVVICGGLNKHFFDWPSELQEEHLRSVVKSGRENWPHILMDSGGIPENVTKDWFEWFLEKSSKIRRNN